MPPVLNRDLSRQLDRRAAEEYGLIGLVLMENAGRGVAERLLTSGPPGPYLVCCGKGNNAGDGFVIARHLDNQGCQVRVAVWTDPVALGGDSLVNYQAIERSGVPIEVFREPNLPRLRELCEASGCVIDALLGTGAVGPPRPPLDAVIEQLNAGGRPIVAVDLPSGLNCDTGQAAATTIRAARTFTFAALKPGFLTPGANTYTGEVEVLSIGVPRKLLEELLAIANPS